MNGRPHAQLTRARGSHQRQQTSWPQNTLHTIKQLPLPALDRHLILDVLPGEDRVMRLDVLRSVLISCVAIAFLRVAAIRLFDIRIGRSFVQYERRFACARLQKELETVYVELESNASKRAA